MSRNVLESATPVQQRGKTVTRAPAMALTEVRAEPLLAVLFWVPTQDPVGKDAVGKDDLSESNGAQSV